jgi:hypothetical protein
MRLKIAGIQHNDVLGRRRLLSWLHELKSSEAAMPTFVAVEYDETTFGRIRAQRRVMRTLAAEVWSGSSPSVLEVMKDSLVYEGDLHESVFPGTETVWLDEGRTVEDPTVVSQYAVDRLKCYKSLVSSGQKTLSEGDLLGMSRMAWENVSALSPNERDAKFARVLLDRCQTIDQGWAIVVVGANHASEVQGSMVTQLRRNGIECEVSRLCPQSGRISGEHAE